MHFQKERYFFTRGVRQTSTSGCGDDIASVHPSDIAVLSAEHLRRHHATENDGPMTVRRSLSHVPIWATQGPYSHSTYVGQSAGTLLACGRLCDVLLLLLRQSQGLPSPRNLATLLAH